MQNQFLSTCKLAGKEELAPAVAAAVSEAAAQFNRDQDLTGGCSLASALWCTVCDTNRDGSGPYLGFDPYAGVRAHYNQLIASYVPAIEAAVAASEDPLRCALAFATGGNLIDFGTNIAFDESSVAALLERIPTLPFAIDHTRELIAALHQAREVVILSDNCGELLLDKVLLATIAREVPGAHLTYMTRHRPVINDSVLEDAQTWGLDAYATLTTNGDQTRVPGTLLERLSPDARERIERADVVISKGMGNFETLYEDALPNVWYLLMNKCEHLKPWLNCPYKSLVCLSPRRLPARSGK
jgi:hypothetical protein